MAQPAQALAYSHGLVTGYIEEELPAGDLMIRLLSEGAGQRHAEHPGNVTGLCLLLGRALGMTPTDMYALGMAALLHDVGKESTLGVVPPHALHECHVGDSVGLANAMGLPVYVLAAMAAEDLQPLAA